MVGRIMRTLLVVVAISTVTPAVWADVIPAPEIHKPMQQGQDVVFGIRVYGSYEEENLARNHLWLDRVAGAGVEHILEDHVFTIDDAVAIETGCTYTHTEEELAECEANPDDCFDCDNDGVPECPSVCRARFTFAVVDDCVPPGQAGYELSYVYDFGLEPEPYLADEIAVTVEDSGDPCLDAGESCSVAAIGGDNPGPAIAFALLALGIAALALGRRSDR